MVICMVAMTSCSEQVAPECGVTLNKDKHDLKLGETYKFVVTSVPSSPELFWMSSKPEICQVDNSGVILGVDVGDSWIYVFNDSSVDSCLVNVSVPDIESLMLNKHDLRLSVGEEAQLKVYLSPSSLDTSIVLWSSSDEAIAVVRQDGTVKAVSSGTAEVRAEAYGISDACRVVVE